MKDPMTLLSSCLVLIADDELANRLQLITALEKFGCEVVAVDDGDIALQRAAEHDFDLILLDCQMPRMTGVQATQAIRATWAEQSRAGCPIVAVTASVHPEQEADYRRAGMADILRKPFLLTELAGIVGKWAVMER